MDIYIERELKPRLHQSIRDFRAVLITGPRQSGKTTFLRKELSNYAEYVTLDDPIEREFIFEDPNGFLDKYKMKPVIIDEIQYAPHILPYIKIRIDEDKFNNKNERRWILTGSQQFQLMKNVSESLAGRIAILELLPFSYKESSSYKSLALSEQIWFGSYPDNFINRQIWDEWTRSYISTYLERDVRQLHNVKDLRIFQNFMSLCAAGHSQELNISKLSNKCGISVPTCKEWISVLEASYIIKLLPPFFNNLGKRIIKSPKKYFWDSALAVYLTKQPSHETLISGAMSGAFFEGLIITEVYKKTYNTKTLNDLYYWRSHDGTEVDLLILKNGEISAIEIKLTETPSSKHSQALLKFEKFTNNSNLKIKEKIIVCNVKKDILLPNKVKAQNWKNFLSDL